MPASSADGTDITWLDVVTAALKHKVLLGSAMGCAAVVSIIVTLVLPNVYTATAQLLPPEGRHPTTSFIFGHLLGGLAQHAGPLTVKTQTDLYLGLLQSRTIADSIIERFDLKNTYGKGTMVETRRQLMANSSISASRHGLITIEFSDTDPERAAEVANYYVHELDRVTRGLAVTEAAQRRSFFEQQLKQAKNDLSDAEIALQVTQETTGLIKLDDQGRAIIEAVASLRAQISAKEVALRSMRLFATEANPEYARMNQELLGLRLQLDRIERSQTSSRGEILMPPGKIPEAGLEYLRKLRDLKYQEAIFELLMKQLEAAKIDEAKDAALIQVIDRAVAPDRRSKPRRTLIVLASTVLAGLFAMAWIVLIEARHRQQKSDFPGFRRHGGDV